MKHIGQTSDSPLRDDTSAWSTKSRLNDCVRHLVWRWEFIQLHKDMPLRWERPPCLVCYSCKNLALKKFPEQYPISIHDLTGMEYTIRLQSWFWSLESYRRRTLTKEIDNQYDAHESLNLHRLTHLKPRTDAADYIRTVLWVKVILNEKQPAGWHVGWSAWNFGSGSLDLQLLSRPKATSHITGMPKAYQSIEHAYHVCTMSIPLACDYDRLRLESMA